MLRSMLFSAPGYFNIYLDTDWNIVWCFNLISRFLITWLFHLDLICPFEHIGCRVFTWWLHYMGLSIWCDEQLSNSGVIPYFITLQWSGNPINFWKNIVQVLLESVNCILKCHISISESSINFLRNCK